LAAFDRSTAPPKKKIPKNCGQLPTKIFPSVRFVGTQKKRKPSPLPVDDDKRETYFSSDALQMLGLKT
jgi:hypothetical protein